MAGPVRALLGYAELQVTAAFPVLFLNECTRLGIPFWGAAAVDACTLRLSLRMSDVRRAEVAGRRCGCELMLLAERGGPAALRRLRRQLYLCVGFGAVLLLLFVSGLYIWEVEVTENGTDVADSEILAVLEDCGVAVGRRWVGLSSDMIRNRALLQLPELGYLTVNIHGSRAEVLVRGREEPPDLLDEHTPTDIRARCSGVITEMRVLEGEALVSVGDTVMAGDALVSAQRGERLVHARAHITARTWHEKTACAPLTACSAEAEGLPRRRWGLILGKRRVNFSINSGIPRGTCDRITKIYPLALPGVFTLPAAVVCESSRELTLRETERSLPQLETELSQRLRRQLLTELGDGGEIVTERFSVSEGDGLLYVTLRAECTERIDTETPYRQ